MASKIWFIAVLLLAVSVGFEGRTFLEYSSCEVLMLLSDI